MPAPIRVGVLGLTHDHVWSNLKELSVHPAARIVAAADRHQTLLGRVESEFHARPYSNYATLLDSEELDAVYIFADNATGAELTEMAASRGLHVLIEKPMAANQAGAERMMKATQDAGTRLMVNWPFAWWPQMQEAIRLASLGAIGDLWQVRYRAAHAGPRELGCSEFFCEWLFDPKLNGAGGAYIDYCCYGALLARVLMGLPTEVTAVGGCLIKTEPVDDNAVLVMRYPKGMAISEGSWTQIGNLTAYLTVIYGTEGTLLLEPRHGGQLFRATTKCPKGEPLSVPEPPAELRSSATHFISCVQSGEPFWALCDPQACYDAQVILEAGVNSLTAGQTIKLGKN
jgi:predicted dehydrogenase